MRQSKPSLAKALPSELGATFQLRPARGENLKLNKHVRAYGESERRLRQGGDELANALWMRATSITFPAAVTISEPGRKEKSMVVMSLSLEYCKWAQDWHLILTGLNILKNGATGRTRECCHMPLRSEFAMARRSLLGDWLPVTATTDREAVC